MDSADCACIYCKSRSGCVPGLSDDDLIDGAKNNHVPRVKKECHLFIQGDGNSRKKALIEKEEFDDYAKNLVKNFAKPCSHPGCSHHVTHPCEKCGKIWK